MQILGQKAELTAAVGMLAEATLLKRRGTPVVTAPPARLDLNRDRPRAWRSIAPAASARIDPYQSQLLLPKSINQ